MNISVLAAGRWVTIGLIVVSLAALASEPVAAQRLTHSPARADQIREMVLAQRERVLERITAILAGEPRAQQEPTDAGAESAAAEASEPDSGEETAEDAGSKDAAESDDGEVDLGESDGEGGGADEEADADADVLELPDTGAGYPAGAPGGLAALAALLSTLGALSLNPGRRLQVPVQRGARAVRRAERREEISAERLPPRENDAAPAAATVWRHNRRHFI